MSASIFNMDDELPGGDRRGSVPENPCADEGTWACGHTHDDVMATAYDQLIQKIGRLPAARVAEVEDFVDFLAQRDRDTDRQLAANAHRLRGAPCLTILPAKKQAPHLGEEPSVGKLPLVGDQIGAGAVVEPHPTEADRAIVKGALDRSLRPSVDDLR